MQEILFHGVALTARVSLRPGYISQAYHLSPSADLLRPKKLAGYSKYGIQMTIFNDHSQ